MNYKLKIPYFLFVPNKNQFECTYSKAVFVCIIKNLFMKNLSKLEPKMGGISIHADFEPTEYGLSCCGSLWFGF